MSAVLSFDLKRCFHILTDEDRWNVLSALMLFANVRNRCWPNMDTIARMATNGNRNNATRAKQWLLQCGAIELVPGDKRVGKDEKALPSRQHVYQLTGKLCIDGIEYQYLYHSAQSGETKADKRMDGHTIDDDKRMDGETIKRMNGHNIDGHTRSITNGSKPKKDSATADSAPKPRRTRTKREPLVFKSKAEQHPEKTTEQLEAEAAAAIQRSIDDGNRALKRNAIEAALYQWVLDNFDKAGDANSEAGKYVHLFMCQPSEKDVKNKTKWATNVLLEPVTADDLNVWARWYRQTALSGDATLSLVKNVEGLVSSINAWIMKGKPDTSNIIRQPTLFTPPQSAALTESERLENARIMREAKAAKEGAS